MSIVCVCLCVMVCYSPSQARITIRPPTSTSSSTGGSLSVTIIVIIAVIVGAILLIVVVAVILYCVSYCLSCYCYNVQGFPEITGQTGYLRGQTGYFLKITGQTGPKNNIFVCIANHGLTTIRALMNAPMGLHSLLSLSLSPCIYSVVSSRERRSRERKGRRWREQLQVHHHQM